jgi:hypothetical protein
MNSWTIGFALLLGGIFLLDCVVHTFPISLMKRYLCCTKLTFGASASLHERLGQDAEADGVPDPQVDAYELCCLCELTVCPFIGREDGAMGLQETYRHKKYHEMAERARR